MALTHMLYAFGMDEANYNLPKGSKEAVEKIMRQRADRCDMSIVMGASFDAKHRTVGSKSGPRWRPTRTPSTPRPRWPRKLPQIARVGLNMLPTLGLASHPRGAAPYAPHPGAEAQDGRRDGDARHGALREQGQRGAPWSTPGAALGGRWSSMGS